MKKLLSVSALLFALLFGAPAQAAGTAPANMTASGAIVGTQIVWCPIGLTSDLKCTFTQIAAYINSLVSGDCTATGTGAFTCTKTNGTAFGGLATVTPGTGVATAAANATNGTGGFVVFGGSAGTLTANVTGNAATVTTNANLTGAVTSSGNAASLGSFSSANLAGALTDETGSGAAVFATSPTLVTPALGTPSALVGTNITGTGAGFTAGNVTTNANLTGDVTSSGNATTLTNAPVIAKVLTGFTSGAGTVSAADSILSALQKINGNDALKAPLASPTFTGTPAAPTATVGTNTTQLATTAFVLANAGSGTGANPTATASDTAVNGVATTYMRSDAAPAVQKTSSSVFGLAKVDGSTITAVGGVISATTGGGGTVTSVAAGCGTSTGGSAITTTGAVTSALTARINTATSGVGADFVSTDCGGVVYDNSASSVAAVLPVATTSGFGANTFFERCNINAGVVTITPTTSTIGGAATLVIAAGSAATPTCWLFRSDGTNYTIVDGPTVNASLLNTGTVAAARLPNPSASTLGGIESLASTAHQWINAISTSGVPSGTQPACGDLSNAGTACQAATGTSGATIGLLNGNKTDSGNNTFTGSNAFGEVMHTVSTQSGTTYTLAAADCGTEVAFTNAAAITVTIPAALTTGCGIALLQTTSAGQVTVTGTAVSAATLHSAHSYTKTFGQWSVIQINIYTTGVAVLIGDGA